MTNTNKMLLVAGLMLALIIAATYALADDTIRECEQTDGSIMYTNKPILGCTDILLPKVSIAPTRTYLPPQQMVEVAPMQATTERPGVQDKICTMYAEWIALNQRTSGGAYYRDFSDNGLGVNSRRLVLANLFSGFVPVGCP